MGLWLDFTTIDVYADTSNASQSSIGVSLSLFELILNELNIETDFYDFDSNLYRCSRFYQHSSLIREMHCRESSKSNPQCYLENSFLVLASFILILLNIEAEKEK